MVRTGASIRNVQMGFIAEGVAQACFARGAAVCLARAFNPVGRRFFAVGPEALPKVICNRNGYEQENE